MACSCKQKSGQVTSVKQVVKKSPSENRESTQQPQPVNKPVIKQIIYKRHI